MFYAATLNTVSTYKIIYNRQFRLTSIILRVSQQDEYSAS